MNPWYAVTEHLGPKSHQIRGNTGINSRYMKYSRIMEKDIAEEHRVSPDILALKAPETLLAVS
jgi:hypothetical protein